MGLIYQNEILYSGSGGGGGTGDVADVYVNGQSVLDANKIAQIKSYKEVTQAEYDALPASKESDDVLYCITDQATADTTVAPIIYSEKEREIGVWTDGKPLYQKTYNISNPSYSSGFSNLIQLTNEDVKTIEGFMISTASGTPILYHPTNSASDYKFMLFIENSYIKYSGNYGGTSLSLISITIQYTKTTDQPGSGKYAPSGIPAVHYSTDEQVVGTWIDGSTIYERTITGNVNLTTTSRTWYQLISATDVTNIWKANKMWIIDASYIIDPGDGTIYTIPSDTGSAYVAAMKVDDGAFKLVAANISTGNAEYAITIQYTKTS